MIQVPMRQQYKLQVRGFHSKLGDRLENSTLTTWQSAVYQHKTSWSLNEVCVSRSCRHPVDSLRHPAQLQSSPFPAAQSPQFISRNFSAHRPSIFRVSSINTRFKSGEPTARQHQSIEIREIRERLASVELLYFSHPFENLVQGTRIKIGPSHICSRRSVREDQSFPVVEPDSLSQNVTCIPRISRPCDLQRSRHCTKDSFSLAVNERG